MSNASALLDVASGAEASRRAAWSAYYRLREQLDPGVEPDDLPPPRQRESHPTVAWLSAVSLPAEIQGSSAIESSSRLVAHALARFVSWAGLCWPSVATIAAASGLSERSVRTHLHELHSAGWLERMDQGGSCGGHTSTWRVAVPDGLAELAVGEGESGIDTHGPRPYERSSAPLARLTTRAVLRRAQDARLTGTQWRVLGALMFYVLQYDKTSDRVANSQIVEMTGISSRHVRAALVDLTTKGVIEREPGNGQTASLITFQP